VDSNKSIKKTSTKETKLALSDPNDDFTVKTVRSSNDNGTKSVIGTKSNGNTSNNVSGTRSTSSVRPVVTPTNEPATNDLIAYLKNNKYDKDIIAFFEDRKKDYTSIAFIQQSFKQLVDAGVDAYEELLKDFLKWKGQNKARCISSSFFTNAQLNKLKTNLLNF
jgi:hypothetical protein